MSNISKIGFVFFGDKNITQKCRDAEQYIKKKNRRPLLIMDSYPGTQEYLLDKAERKGVEKGIKEALEGELKKANGKKL